MPEPDEPNEITVPDEVADAGHPVGSHIDACFVVFDEALAYGQGVLEGTRPASSSSPSSTRSARCAASRWWA